MVQVFAPSPRAMQAGQIGQAIGQGIGIHSQRGQMQNQQNQIAKALFGNQSEQFSELPIEEQFKIASFLQNQQNITQNNRTEQQNLLAQKNLSKQLFPENAEEFSQLPVQQQINLSNLFKRLQDADFKQKMINSLFGGQEQPKESDLLSNSQIAAVASVDPNLAKILQMQKDSYLKEQRAVKKEEQAKEEAKKPFDTAQKSFDSMAQLLKKGNLGLGSGALAKTLGGKRAKDVAQFTSATGGLEALLVDMVSRGTLSNARFQYITETLLPKPGDRDKEIEGKMMALADLLGLDPSELTGKKTTIEKGKKQSLEDIWK